MTEELEEHWRIALTPEEREWESGLSISRPDLIKIFPESKTIFKERLEYYNDLSKITSKKFNEVMNFISSKESNFKTRETLFDICRESVESDLDDYDKIIKECNFYLSFFGKKQHGLLDIEKAKQFPISDLLEFNRAGFAKCIWHNEKTASLKYYDKTNTVYCFSCSRKGDAIDVAQEIYKEDFSSTVKRLAK